MKNIVISQNSDVVEPNLSPKDTQRLLNTQIQYFHELIQKTLISIQKYKQLDIIGANELNQGTQQLESLYRELSNNKLLLYLQWLLFLRGLWFSFALLFYRSINNK